MPRVSRRQLRPGPCGQRRRDLSRTEQVRMNRHRNPFPLAVAALLLFTSGCARVPSPVATAGPSPAYGIAAAPGTCLDVVPDADEDGLTDACELALSRAFAPLLMMHSTRCTLPSAGTQDRIAGGYLHAAQPAQGVVRLVYMPAYYRDCGWTGFKCIFVDCSGHAGDSEIIAVDVRQLDNGAWATDAIFLSAHCFGRSDGDCRWYRDDDLDAFEWVNDIERGAPVVWVSEARNANYPSYAACERGHWRIDRCDRASVPFLFPVAVERNIGSREVPLVNDQNEPGCVSGRFVEPVDRMIVAPDAVECFWSTEGTFGGWQGAEGGATPYGRYLEHLGL